jgi:hypothetical protein
MLDLKRYARLYPTGATRVEKIEGGIVVMFKRFDNETGTELTPEPNYTTIEALEKDKAELTSQLEGIEILFEEIKKL